MIYERETITPEKAIEYLGHNVNNRTVKKGNVDMLAREIESGSWQLTHQGIAFDSNGNLLDGQHRLLAIIKANKPVEMMVARGVEAVSSTCFDRGTQRTTTDILKLSGKGADIVEFRDSHTISSVTFFIAAELKRNVKLSANEVIWLTECMPEAFELVYNATRRRKTSFNSAPCSAAGLAAFYCGESREDIEQFFKVFGALNYTECMDKNFQYVIAWREAIDKARMNRAPKAKDELYKGTQEAIYNFIHTKTKTPRHVDKRRYDASKTAIAAIQSRIELGKKIS